MHLLILTRSPLEIIFPEDPILPQFPQNIQLLWNPLHVGGFPVRYEVNIWERLPGLTDQQVVYNTLPYYVHEVSQITSSFLTAADPSLIVGQEYLMRVQVKDDVNGAMGPPGGGSNG